MKIGLSTYVSSSVVFLPLIIILLRKKYLTKELKILFLYIIASILFEIFSVTWGKILHKPNHFILNIFALTEGVLISCVFQEAFINKKLKRITFIIISIYVLVSIFLFAMPNGFFKFNSIVNTISCLLIIIWVFVYFYQLLQTLQVIKLYMLPLFWISVGSLLYFSGTLFIFLYSDTILFQKVPILYYQLWNIYYVLLFVFRILLAVGLWFSKTAIQMPNTLNQK
ncbi:MULTISPECIES: hypothetical protein [unclassified Arcicella]|uniref:hypothetical protein n=1 Tax=unclassified Arcicella TaxID=2644986 RepID=UPI00285C2C05|nr:MULTISPECIES: hypothetical protein [unclassified Arcicella]MDR6561118.1 hypothetical protein [Arcicella sp. BE51]MDR6811002.1 hypothetical protein [Arcicella sp. BE140]MDR6822352.1 hypothetical protein [Arcicella sp. BE139]